MTNTPQSMSEEDVQGEINLTVLEQKIVDVLGKYHDAEPHKYLEAAEIIPLITQYSLTKQLEARIDELENRLRVQFIPSHWERLRNETNSWAKYVDRRISELKHQLGKDGEYE